MNVILAKVLFFAVVASGIVANADPFEEKRDAAIRQNQAKENARYIEYQTALLNKLNASLLAAIPRDGQITKCLTHSAVYSFQRSMTEWNGMPLTIGPRDSSSPTNLPYHLRACRYHNRKTGADCEVYAYGYNSKGGYAGTTTTCY